MSLVIVPHEPAVWYMETPATLSFSIIPAPLRTFPPILGGIATIKVPPSKLWTPDHFYNINNRGGCHFAPILSEEIVVLSGTSPAVISYVSQDSFIFEFDGINTYGFVGIDVKCNLLNVPNQHTEENTYPITFTYLSFDTEQYETITTEQVITLIAEKDPLPLATSIDIQTKTSGFSLTLEDILTDMKAPFAIQVSYPNAVVELLKPDSTCTVNNQPVIPIIANSTSVRFPAPKSGAAMGTKIDINCKEAIHVVPDESQQSQNDLDVIIQYNKVHERRLHSSYEQVDISAAVGIQALYSVIFILSISALFSYYF